MSSYENAITSVIAQLALSLDGAVLGVALAYTALRSLFKYSSYAKSLRTIQSAPYVTVSDLRYLIESDDRTEGKVVVVRGHVAPNLTSSNKLLVSTQTRDKAVIIQSTQTCIYNEWRGFVGWTSDFRGLFRNLWSDQDSKSLRSVPFVLVDSSMSNSDFVVVNVDGSTHALPLVTVYHHLRPVDASPYTFLQAFFGHEYPVGLLEEEKILPLGKEISAVGFCGFRNGIRELKWSKDLPYFLSDLTKDQMVTDLVFKTRILFWSGIVIGSLSIGILGYAIMRNWNRLKTWRQNRQINQSTSAADVVESDAEEEGDVPEGQLCVICLMRRRRAAFIPCGHLICCRLCAISVERQVSPKCPLCRQEVRSSMRIFEC